ncbi:hypothetical protein BC941DRAFT_66174 [Chlamydoabsidia padenii]|nr:hypothetical protein BC941DRAFT_66174 [Chlamydoabsidia padenii]
MTPSTFFFFLYLQFHLCPTYYYYYIFTQHTQHTQHTQNTHTYTMFPICKTMYNQIKSYLSSYPTCLFHKENVFYPIKYNTRPQNIKH